MKISVRRLRRATRRRLGPAGRVILMYHRIAEPDLDPWELAVRPDHFSQHLAVLRRTSAPVDLDTLLSDGMSRRRPTVAVTFDDGYLDTLTLAAEATRRAEVATTVFISTAGVEGRPHCWWDQLAEALLRPGQLPRRLRLSIGQAAQSWDLGADRSYSGQDAARHVTWRASDAPPTARHAVYLDIWRRVIEQPDHEQRRITAAVRRWSDAPVEPPGRLLTGPEITRLGARPGITVGGHTVNHLALPSVDGATRDNEIRTNRRQLRRLTGQRVDHFAYPYGRYSLAAVSSVRAAGFSSAATTDPGPVPRRGDAFSLPRVQVPDLDGPTFERWLRRLSRQGAP